MITIHQWADIKSHYKHNLLLGNGSSIAVSPTFSYRSLYTESKNHGYISPTVEKLFSKFHTTDFEEVLKALWYAESVNRELGLPVRPLQSSYREVRDALVSTIRVIHPEYTVVEHHLSKIYKYMKKFKNVVSMNYDLIPYWAMLNGNEEFGCTWFKDGFVRNRGREFAGNIKFLRKYHGKCKGATLLFYPHGNLAFAQENGTKEIKIRRSAINSLLEEIVSYWKSGLHVPLFVSEGTSRNKLESINRSKYLNNIFYEILPNLDKTLVVYGWRIGAQDKHILEKLGECSFERVAVSVNGSGIKAQRFCDRAKRQLNDVGIKKVEFFDSKSSGCWVH